MTISLKAGSILLGINTDLLGINTDGDNMAICTEVLRTVMGNAL